MHRSSALAGLGRFDLSMADADEAVIKSGYAVPQLLHRAGLFQRLDRLREAAADAERILAQEPNHAGAWQILGTIRYFAGDLHNAISDLSQCLSRAPGDMLALNNRGAAYFLLGQYAAADADLRTAVERAPTFASGRKNLAWMRATCPDEQYRNGDEAVNLATQAIEMIRGDQPAWLEVLAAAYAEKGEFAAAIQWQQKALQELAAGADSPSARRLQLYQSHEPFRHSCRPGQPLELIPGGRVVTPLRE
jgi:tetratricopeptide (TPR) repeat protein